MSTTVTASTRTFESTGNFAQATINPNQIIKFSYSATGENLYTLQIATNANDNTITADPLESYHGTITDDSSELYSWDVWDPYVAFTMTAPTDSGTYALSPVIDIELDFGDKGYWFPNLAMHTLSTSAIFELLLR